MTVLVTGANGFVGRNLIQSLHINRRTFGNIINVSRRPFTSSFIDKSYKCDLGFSDQEDNRFYALRNIMKEHKPEYIFHLASKATVKMTGNEPFQILQDNILSTQKICQVF